MAGDATIKIAGDNSDLRSVLADSQTRMENFGKQIKASFDDVGANIGASLQGVRNSISAAFQVTGVAVLAEGFDQIKNKIMEMTAAAVNIRNMSEVLGVTTDQFQAMGSAAEEAGIGQETLFRATEKLKQTLADARDGSGAAIVKLHELGITNEQIADKTFGTNEMLTVLGERLRNTATATATMAALTKELGARAALAAEAMKAYDGSIERVKKQNEEVNALLPEQIKRLTEVHGWWVKVGEAIANTFEKLLVYSRNYNPGIDMLGGAEVNNSAQIAAAQQLSEVKITAAKAAMNMDLGAISAVTLADLHNLEDRIEAETQGTRKRLDLVKEYYAETLKYYGSSNVGEVRAAYKMLLEAERAYKEQQFAMEKEGDARILASHRHQVEETIKLGEKGLEEQKKQAEGAAEAHREAALAGIQAQRDVLELQNAGAGPIAKTAQLEQDRTLITQELLVWHQYYETLRNYAADNQAQIDAINHEELAKTTQLTHQGTQDQIEGIRTMQQAWQSALKPITTQFSEMVSSVVTGTSTMAAAFDKMALSMVQKMIQLLIQRGVQHVVDLALNKEEQRSDAAAAAAAAMKSAAQIPYIGWVLAPAAAAAVYAGALAFSAKGGYDIPAGINPATQLHSREMVLPANLADTVRAMAAGGGSAGETHVHNHNHNWNVMDGPSVRKFLDTHKDKFAKAMEVHIRGNRGRYGFNG